MQGSPGASEGEDPVRPIHAVALLAIVAAGALLRFHGLDRESIWVDEAFSIALARRPLADVVAFKDVHPPLYNVLLWGWMCAFGDRETAVRSLSAVLGVLALPVMFVLGRRLLGTRLALAATLLLACSPYHVYYSQEARNYALVVVLAIASQAALLAWDATGRAAPGAAYVAATAGMAYTHVYGLFVWAGQLVWMIGRRKHADRRSLRALAPFAAVALSLVPWIGAPWTAALLHQSDTGTTGLRLLRPGAATLFTSFVQFAGSPITAAILLPLAALEALRGWRGRSDGSARLGPHDRTLLLLGWLALPHAVPFLYSLVSVPVYITRATIVSLPALYLLVAAFLGRVGGRARGTLLAAMAVASLAVQGLYFQVPSKEQWREAAALVDRFAQPGDAVVFDAGYGRGGFDYYSRRAGLLELASSRDVTSPDAAKAIDEAVVGRRRLWLVRFQRPPEEEKVRRALSDWRSVGSARFIGIDLYLFERTAGSGGDSPPHR